MREFRGENFTRRSGSGRTSDVPALSIFVLLFFPTSSRRPYGKIILLVRRWKSLRNALLICKYLNRTLPTSIVRKHAQEFPY